MTKTYRIQVKGRVQGVFFRKYTQQSAKTRDIKGLVRNLSDGSVEIIAQGEWDNLESFINWCWEGSPHSNVSDVSVLEIEGMTNYYSFDIDY